jgi:hypothetical protein
MNPIIAGWLPKCVILLKIATLDFPSKDFVAMRLADLYPVQELIRFSRSIFSMLEMSSLVIFFIIRLSTAKIILFIKIKNILNKNYIN